MAAPRVLLLVSSLSYRSEAFLKAADALGLDVVKGLDIPPELADYWKVPLGVPFNRPAESAAAIAEYARNHRGAARARVVDGSPFLAARAAEHLDLPFTDPDAAVAARDKFEMRTRFAAARVPSPPFRRVSLGADPAAIAPEVAFPCVLK